jgi:hypothetical protein
MKTKYGKWMSSILTIGVFLFFALGSEDSNSSESDQLNEKDKALQNVSFKGSVASLNYSIEEGCLSAQVNHEYDILKSIFYIYKEGGINEIKITATDFCVDSYGHKEKRYWHRTITPDWVFWNEISKYANASSFAKAYYQGYIISSYMDEGTWFSCARDGGCSSW